MSIYIPIQKDDRPVHDEALACEEDFQRLLVVVSNMSVQENLNQEIKEYHQKFTLWARRLCVFSDSTVSLDSRLEDYPGAYGVVSANLSSLKSSLNQCEYDQSKLWSAFDGVLTAKQPSGSKLPLHLRMLSSGTSESHWPEPSSEYTTRLTDYWVKLI